MYRSLALLALPLLVAGCGAGASSTSSTRSAPPPTIDSFRSSYFNEKQSASPQVAAIPAPEASAVPQSDRPADQAAAPEATEAAATPAKPAAPQAYKASVAAYIKRYAVDKDSLKLAKIGTPFPGSVNGQKGSVVCVELGGASYNRTAYLLKDNHVADSEFGAEACRGKQLAPWDSAGT